MADSVEAPKKKPGKRKPPRAVFTVRKNARQKRNQNSNLVTPLATLSSPAKTIPTTKIHTVPSAKKAVYDLLELLFEDTGDRKSFLENLLADFSKENDASNSAAAVVQLDPVHAIASASNPRRVLSLPPPIQLNRNAFDRAFRKDDSSRKAKDRLVDKLDGFIKKLGTPEQQFLVLHDYWKNKEDAKPLGQSLLASVKKDGASLDDLGFNVMENLREILSLAHRMNKNNQVKALNTFQRTLMMSISPPSFEENTDRHKAKVVTALMGAFGQSRYRTNRLLVRGMSDRRRVAEGNPSLFLPSYQRRSSSRYSKELIVKLHQWLYNHCDNIVVSPHSKDTRLVPNIMTGEKERQQKYYYRDGVADILVEAGKPVAEGGFDGPRKEGVLLISDTMLRAMLPVNVSRMTNSQMDLCACEDCFIPKKQVAAMNVFAYKWIKEKKQDPDFSSSDLESVIDFFYEEYDQNTRRFDSPYSLLKAMTCAPVLGDLFHMRCCLGRCENCPSLSFPSCLMNEVDAPRISFVTFDYHSFCKIHKSLDGAPSKCPHCEEEKKSGEHELSTKKTFFRKKQVTNNNEPFPVFVNEYLFPIMRKLRYHLEYVILLGKNYCISDRRRTALKAIGSLLILRDFMDPLTCTMNGQFQSTHFGENAQVNMEGIAARYREKEQAVEPVQLEEDCPPLYVEPKSVYEWHGLLADSHRQDSRTVYANTNVLLSNCKSINEDLLTPGSMLFDQSDGAGKQYRNGTALKLSAAIACKHQIHINKMITAPHHGKADADAQGGQDKHEMKVKFKNPSTIGVDHNDDAKVTAATVDENGRRVSMAAMAKVILSHPSRNKGKVGYGLKHRKRENNKKFKERIYHHIDTGVGDSEATSTLQLVNTNFKADGFVSKRGLQWEGLNAHYHFYFSFELGPNKAAARRVPCSCPACADTLQKPWDTSLEAEDQPRFATPADCSLSEVLSGYNDWKVLDLIPSKKNLDETEQHEIAVLKEDILSEMEADIASQIEPGDFGAYECDSSSDDYYIVQWTSRVFEYTEEVGPVEGAQMIEVGEPVVKGFYMDKPGRARQWYVIGQPEVERVFRVRYIPVTVLKMETTQQKTFPLGTVARRDRQRILDMEPLRLADESHQKIMVEITRRASIDYEEDFDIIASDCEEEEDGTEQSESELESNSDEDY